MFLTSIPLARPSVNNVVRDHAEQQHIAAQQKAALQVGYLLSQGRCLCYSKRITLT